jgi:hypothetical protein
MSRTLVFYISGHGFGHASRDVEILNALHALAPDVRVVVRTSAPRWLFDLTLTGPIDWQPRECDTGIVQVDSLRLDLEATLRRAEAFHATLDTQAAEEARFLRDAGARLVVGDIPPLAFAAAAAAGLPSTAIGNFTWDWVYAGYEETEVQAPRLLPALRAAYAHATEALRLPVGGGFEAFARVIDVPFVARRSRRDPRETRQHLGLPDGRLVLASFGGYGLRDIDLSHLAALEGWTVVTTSSVQARRRDPEPGATEPHAAAAVQALPPTVRFVDEKGIYAAGYRYEDLVAAVDAVATKPGYGILAECIANGAAIVYTSRGRFVEYEVMVREMPKYVRCEFLSNEELYDGRWQRALDAVVAQPKPPESPRVDGAEVIAARLVERL